jgi:hypothetical protein
MAWDPTVLRKYNTTGHFRLLNQLRGELKDNPLVRPKDGETVGDVNRSKALIRVLEGRQASGSRGRRGGGSSPTAADFAQPAAAPLAGLFDGDDGEAGYGNRFTTAEQR